MRHYEENLIKQEVTLGTPIHMMDMTWQDVKDAIAEHKILIFTAGTVEQHGPHLPLGVDTYLPMAIASRLAERVGAAFCWECGGSRNNNHQSDKRYHWRVYSPGMAANFGPGLAS